MNKSELVDKVAKDVDLAKTVTTKVLDSILDAISDAVTRGDAVTIPGFGTWAAVHRAAREGRNPRTGQKIQIRASKTVKFRVGKTFKDAVQR